jgi:glycosyltransferase involved in cell wall biosynthesis
MIVKDEAHIIHESLKATLPLIDTYCIVDTGSVDDTIQKIRDFYSDKGISGEIHERPWKNFGHNRSEALKLCDGKMDYILVIDADDLMGFPSNGKDVLTSLLEKEQPNGV